MSVIRKFLDLSCAHLDESDKAFLDVVSMDGTSICGPPTYSTEYGWFVWCPTDPSAYSDEALPPHIRTICAFAKERDCDYVLFDADAEIDPELPVYEEENA